MSFILNGVTDQRISDTTRDTVLQAAKELDYRPNRNAQNLAFGVSSTLLCFMPRAQLGEVALTILSELTAELSSRGLTLAVYFESGDRSVLGQLVKELQPRLVFSPYGRLPAWAREKLAGSVEILDVATDPDDATDVGSIAQVEYLIGRGHRRIAFVGVDDEATHEIIERRRRTVQAATARLGGQPATSTAMRPDGSNGTDVLSHLRAEGVTAVCCYNDRVALMLLSAARSVGLRLPEDLAVVGYDDSPEARWAVPTLTTVHWDPRGAAMAYAEGIFSSTVPGAVIDPHSFEQQLGSRIVVRESA